MIVGRDPLNSISSDAWENKILKLDLYIRQKAMLARFQTPAQADRELNLSQASYAWRNPYGSDFMPESVQQKDKAILDQLFGRKKS